MSYQVDFELYGREYVELFGALEIEWNYVETLLFLIFYKFSGTTLDKSHNIYFSVVAHRGRRELLEAVAESALASYPKLERQFTSLMRRVKNAATKRNQVIHTMWNWSNGTPMALFPVDGPLTGADAKADITSRIATIEAVGDDLGGFYDSLPHRKPRERSRAPARPRRS